MIPPQQQETFQQLGKDDVDHVKRKLQKGSRSRVGERRHNQAYKRNVGSHPCKRQPHDRTIFGGRMKAYAPETADDSINTDFKKECLGRPSGLPKTLEVIENVGKNQNQSGKSGDDFRNVHGHLDSDLRFHGKKPSEVQSQQRCATALTCGRALGVTDIAGIGHPCVNMEPVSAIDPLSARLQERRGGIPCAEPLLTQRLRRAESPTCKYAVAVIRLANSFKDSLTHHRRDLA